MTAGSVLSMTFPRYQEHEGIQHISLEWQPTCRSGSDTLVSPVPISCNAHQELSQMTCNICEFTMYVFRMGSSPAQSLSNEQTTHSDPKNWVVRKDLRVFSLLHILSSTPKLLLQEISWRNYKQHLSCWNKDNITQTTAPGYSLKTGTCSPVAL